VKTSIDNGFLAVGAEGAVAAVEVLTAYRVRVEAADGQLSGDGRGPGRTSRASGRVAQQFAQLDWCPNLDYIGGRLRAGRVVGQIAMQ